VLRFFVILAFATALGTFEAEAQLSRAGQPDKPQEKPKTPQRAANEKIFPLKASWVAVSLNGKPLGSGSGRPTFVLDENLRAHGFSGCNNYSATAYPLRQNKLGVGPVALTRKACDKATMDRERDYLMAFKASQEWDLQEGALIFKGQRGTIRFERVL
jgi:heat shock protein HslJ